MRLGVAHAGRAGWSRRPRSGLDRYDQVLTLLLWGPRLGHYASRLTIYSLPSQHHKTHTKPPSFGVPPPVHPSLSFCQPPTPPPLLVFMPHRVFP